VLAGVETHSSELTEGPADGNLALGFLRREGGSCLGEILGLTDCFLLQSGNRSCIRSSGRSGSKIRSL